MLFEMIRDCLVQMLGCDPDRIRPSTVLLEDLELEQADLCDLMMELEDELPSPICWSEETLARLATVEDMIRFIESQI